VGRAFRSTSVTEHCKARPLVPGTHIELLIWDEHSIGVDAGCNHLTGQIRLEGDRLVLGETTSTLIGCLESQQAQDDWVRRFLGSRPTWQVSGDDLVLRTTDAEIRLTDFGGVPSPPP